MKSLNELMQEVIQITSKIETEYPELYTYLGETPLTACVNDEKTLCAEDLKKYLDTLKSQLNHHIETHKMLVK